MRAPVLDLHGHVDEVAGIAHRRRDVDDTPVEETGASVVVEEIADVWVTVHDGGGPGSIRPERDELAPVFDVDLGGLGERVAEPIAMVVETVAKQGPSRSRDIFRKRRPRHLGLASVPVFETDVERGEVFQCRGRRIG